jgi:hypothetical protein
VVAGLRIADAAISVTAILAGEFKLTGGSKLLSVSAMH